MSRWTDISRVVMFACTIFTLDSLILPKHSVAHKPMPTHNISSGTVHAVELGHSSSRLAVYRV